MNLRVYERYVGPLSVEEKDRYCDEATAIERRSAFRSGACRAPSASSGRYMDAMLSSGEIAVTDTARMLARDVIHPPTPRLAAPALALVRLQTVGLLPRGSGRGTGSPGARGGSGCCALSTGVARDVLRVTPSIVRHWPAARRARRRASR